MKWIAIVVIVFLLAGAGLLGWQLVDTYRANVALSNRVIELEAIESAESAFYRGFVGSCVGIGVKQSVPKDIISSTCGSYMAEAYKNDFYRELMPDDWVWPPVADGTNHPLD